MVLDRCELDETELEENGSDDDEDSDDSLEEIYLRDDAQQLAKDDTEQLQDGKLYSIHHNYCRDEINFDDLIRVIIKVLHQHHDRYH